MGTPSLCVSKTQGRSYMVCCPGGATQTWDSTDDCTIGGENTQLPSIINKCTPTWASCWPWAGTLSSCTAPYGRTYNACCPDGATQAWEPGTSCTSGGLKDTGDDDLAGSNVTDIVAEDSATEDSAAEDSAVSPSSLMTVIALGVAVAAAATAALASF